MLSDTKYLEYSKLLKAVADPKRLKIVGLLAQGEMCAGKILEEFKISQPTLSHDMKILCEAGIAINRKDGRWAYYSLCSETVQKLQDLMTGFLDDSQSGNNDAKSE